jgi:hypothetical protein
MKTSRDQMNQQNKQGKTKVPKPEIRDDIDSRKNEEFEIKGDDVTHNIKEKKSERKKKKDIK